MNEKSRYKHEKLNKYREIIKQNIISQQISMNNASFAAKQYTGKHQRPYQEYGVEKSNVKDSANYHKMPSSISRSNLRKNPSQLLMTQNNNEQSLDKKYQQPRTVQKQSTSRSPIKPDTQHQAQAMTKRKPSTKQIHKSNLRVNQHPYINPGHNLSSFETFSPKPTVVKISNLLPSLSPILNPSSSNFAEQQVKVLLDENQILSLHLAQKMQRIKSLQRELKCAVKSQILHEQKYDISFNQLTSQNGMIKKSTDQQLNTLVKQIKKLNDEIKQQEQEWQSRLNLIRKHHLQQSQQTAKSSRIQQQKHKIQMQQLRIQLLTMKQQFTNVKQSNQSTVSDLQQQIKDLQSTIQQLSHLHKVQKSQIVISHQNKMKQLQDQHRKKLQLFNLDKCHKQNGFQNTIQILNKQVARLQQELDNLRRDHNFKEIKEMQQRGRLMIQLKQQKERASKVKIEENNKLRLLSKAELQTAITTHDTEISEYEKTITNLECLLWAREQQMANLYKEISDIRRNYQKQLLEKEDHIQKLNQKIFNIQKQNEQQTECFKIKLAQLTQSNTTSLQQLYQNTLSEQKQLLIDKQLTIKSLREQICAQIQQINLLNQQHFKQAKELKIKIQQFQQQITQRTLKERNGNKVTGTEKQNLKQNLLRQAQFFQKASFIKDQNIKRLERIIQTKDREIEQLEKKLELLRLSHKQELQLLKQQHSIFSTQQQELITSLKDQLEYNRNQVTRKSQQFSKEKDYFSNQLRQLKSKQEKDFNEWVQKLSSEVNALKVENQELKLLVEKVKKEYQTYKGLWNQEQILVRLKQQEEQFEHRLRQDFTSKQAKMVVSYQEDIQKNYTPKIQSLKELLEQKQQQIQDMKMNYHELQKKFEQIIEQKEEINEINSKILQLGTQTSQIYGSYVRLGQ